MLARIRKAAHGEESGFTLIELLVVMIIIGILAAIAIPTFLNQRKGGWRSAVQSDLRNASTAVESWASENGGVYNPTGNVLSTAVLNGTGATDVQFKGTDSTNQAVSVSTSAGSTVTATRYCLQVTDSRLNETWRYFKGTDAAPNKAACP